MRNFKKCFQKILTGEIADSDQVFHYADEVSKFEHMIMDLVKKSKEEEKNSKPD